MHEEQIAASVQKQAKDREAQLEEAMKVNKTLEAEDDLFRVFAMKEMERFQSQGKKTDLLKKVLILLNLVN